MYLLIIYNLQYISLFLFLKPLKKRVAFEEEGSMGRLG